MGNILDVVFNRKDTSTTKVEEDGLKWVSSRIEGTWPFSLGLE